MPFGEEVNPQNTTNHYKFTGDEHDTESDLEHTQFRQLSTVQGRWVSPDPYLGSMDLTNPQSLNRYAYVLNGPMNFFDPLGLITVHVEETSSGTNLASPTPELDAEKVSPQHRSREVFSLDIAFYRTVFPLG